ncbi:MAG TPA: DUF4232 domain-containing protein [Streptosporangiaceae bacterium]|nr:DUF4232 domain-containing protein [Streptosporangiaceae bacterium]
MKIVTRLAVAGAAAAAAIGAAGCGSGGAGGVPAPPAATATPAGAAVTAPAATPAAGGRCHTAGLSVTLGAPQGQPGTQRTVSVVFTNTSGASCTMYGYPGVNLVQATSDQWSLVRQSAPVRTVALAPGASAHATLTFYQWSASVPNVKFAPARLLVTPPDETSSATVGWLPGIIVVRQDGATHPLTYIGPVTAGQ